MHVQHRRGGGSASNVVRGGGCASGVTRVVAARPALLGEADERPTSTGRQMCVQRRLGKAERSGRSQRGGAVLAGGRAVGDFSGLVGRGLSVTSDP
jgi:hypothetical protein